ncbi:DUF1127 domain-containing protein [uncultured Litoreibacter sp.]|uniref:DUF1127 domain-containing protein n=1 Tax=uncultured Litoreibacter sp. TaxID=1392394 RepID=UPI002617BC80|nr:DUF1127 domain-containing protein [uncultured Litoreibacter sp.]
MTNFISSTIPLSRATSRRTGVMGYIDLYRQRRALAALDDTRLADIGLNRAEAEAEAARPVWDAPSYWK